MKMKTQHLDNANVAVLRNNLCTKHPYNKEEKSQINALNLQHENWKEEQITLKIFWGKEICKIKNQESRKQKEWRTPTESKHTSLRRSMKFKNPTMRIREKVEVTNYLYLRIKEATLL